MQTLLLVLLLASTPAGSAAETRAVEARPADNQALEHEIDVMVKPYLDHHVFSGVILLAKGDQVLVNRPYGNANYEFKVPHTPESRFPIASITKRFTQVILHRLQDEKKLSFTDPLSKYVADFPSADKITIDQLIRHTSGIRDPKELRRMIRVNLTTGEVIEKLKREPLASIPGETYSYTTANYSVLAHVIEKVTNRLFADVVRDYIYDPARMHDSGELATTAVVPRLSSGYMPHPFSNALAVCGPEDTSWKAAGGSSYSTTRDLHRYLRAFYGGKLLSTVEPVDLFRHGKVFDKTVSRSGGAFPGANAQMWYFPDEEVTIVVLSNNYAFVTEGIAERVAAIYFNQPYKVPDVSLATEVRRVDPRMLGTYTIEGLQYPFTIALRDGRPSLVWNEIRQEAMLLMPDGTWFMPLDWATLAFPGHESGDYKEGIWTAPWADGPLKVKRSK